MQISDMLGQYNRNVTNGTEELRGAQGVQKLVSTVGDLSAGSVFEGTVNYMKNGKVVLALGNGQVLTARLEGKVDMKPGSSMFFQVRSNDGTTVSLRPYTGVGNASNPILLNALTAAQVPATERTLMMVDAMMQEQMPINRQSIVDMVKILNSVPDANVQTVVQMTKMGLPVTEEMAAQFEHYLTEQHALLNEMELAVGQIAETLGDETMTAEDSVALYQKVVDIFLSDEPVSGSNPQAIVETDKENANQASRLMEIMGKNPKEPKAAASDEPGIFSENGTKNPAAGELQRAVYGEPLGRLLSEEQLFALTKTIQNIPILAGDTELFTSGETEELFVDTMQDEQLVTKNPTALENEQSAAEELTLKKDMTAGEFLRTLQRAFAENGEYGFTGAQKLFARKEFQLLLKNTVEQQWLIKPQDLKEENKISALYEKMERQMNQMEAAMKASGITQNSFLHTAADIRGNIEFMNQMNQIYNYVQMPLKMSGQNANGELYVYTNKKNLQDPEAELSAFLHLDLDSLGTTDVSVRMKNRQVKTNFYFEDDASYRLVEKHLPILEKRLNKKGYTCTFTITNEKKNSTFKENFVKRGRVSSGSLHRYSFDVRA